MSDFQLPKDAIVYKDWVFAIGEQVDNLHPKSLYVQAILKEKALSKSHTGFQLHFCQIHAAQRLCFITPW